MKAIELREKKVDELKNLLEKGRKSMRKHVEEITKGKEKNTGKLKYMRREVAQILTVINEKSNLEKTEEYE